MYRVRVGEPRERDSVRVCDLLPNPPKEEFVPGTCPGKEGDTDTGIDVPLPPVTPPPIMRQPGRKTDDAKLQLKIGETH